MLSMMEAIERRVSCRSYEKKPLEPSALEKLTDCVNQLRDASGIGMELVTVEDEKDSVKLARSMFNGGVTTYLMLTGDNSPATGERAGYYAHQFVLYATRLGLGTCWVAGTYDHHSVHPKLAEGEQVLSVIPVGYPTEKVPLKQSMIRAGLRKGDRKDEAFVESELLFTQLPEWFRRCVEAVRMGPSAVNGQPINLSWQDGVIRAKVWKENHRMEYLDLGIAKAQFEAAAHAQGIKGRWELGTEGRFQWEQSE